MDNSTDAKSTCAGCGEPMTEEHSCSPVETATDTAANTPANSNGNGHNGSGDEPRIAIPESLWASGLFKPAFSRGAAVDATGPVRSGSRGTIFARGDDAEPADTEPATNGAVTEADGTSELEDTPEPEVAAPAHEAAHDTDTDSAIDDWDAEGVAITDADVEAPTESEHWTPEDTADAPAGEATTDEPETPEFEDTEPEATEPEATEDTEAAYAEATDTADAEATDAQATDDPWAWSQQPTEDPAVVVEENPADPFAWTAQLEAEEATADEPYDPFAAFEPQEPTEPDAIDDTPADDTPGDGPYEDDDAALHPDELTDDFTDESEGEDLDTDEAPFETETEVEPEPEPEVAHPVVPLQRDVDTIFDDEDGDEPLDEHDHDDHGDNVVPLVRPEAATDDETPHFGSADLPAAVPFGPRPTDTTGIGPETDPGTSPEAESTAPEKKSRRGLLVGLLVLALVAVGAGGWWAWQRQQDEPIRTAFDASHEQFVNASTQLQAARSIDQVALAGAEFGKAVPLLEETSEAARERSSSYATAARRAALAELEVATAGAGLAELSTTSLSAWSATRPSLEEALEGLAGAADDVKLAGGSGEKIIGTAALEAIQQMIGEEVAESAAENAADFLDRIDNARLVAEWRGIGKDAGALVGPTRTAETEFGDDAAKAADLAAYRAFFESVNGLSGLRPAKLDGWEPVKEKIESAARDLPTQAQRAGRVVAALDRRVVESRTKFANWQTAHAAAKAEKEQGLEQLTAAREAVPGISDAYAGLRADVDGIIGRGDSFTADGEGGEAHQALLAAADSLGALQARLAGLRVPSSASGELAALAQVISDDAGAVRWAADAAAACTGTCVITTRPGWNAMVDRVASRGTSWDTARTAWTTAADAARAELREITLPELPKI